MPRAASVLIAVVLAALVLALLPATTAAAATVAVRLDITTKAGTPLSGLEVYAYPVDSHAVVGQGVRATALGGRAYELSLDDTKRYALWFDAPQSSSVAFDQFWGGTTWVEEARYWSSADGRSLDITLATNSAFTGKVTGTGGVALSGVSVVPWRFDGNDWFRLGNAAVRTASNGVYTVRNLEPGSYRLEFAPANTTGYLPEFSGNRTAFATATAFSLGLGATISHNAVLATGGTLTGKVRIFKKEGAAAVRTEYLPYGITAYAYPSAPDGTIDTSRVYVSKPTGTTGAWSIAGLPTGTYKVKLYDTEGAAFVDVWVGKSTANPTGAASVSGAAIYAVTAGGKTATSGVPELDYYDDLLPTSVDITARDRDGAGLGLGADLYIESLSGEDFYLVSDGRFGLTNGTLHLPYMPVGSYRVWIDPNDGRSQPYVGTESVVAQTGGNTWTFDLDPVSPFSYSTSATVPTAGRVVGTTLVANRGKTTMDDGAGIEQSVRYTYMWLRDGQPIYGAQGPDASTYTLGGRDVGAALSLIVRADSFGYDPVFTPVDLGTALAAPAPTATTAPTIAAPASPVPGTVLSAKPGTWNVADVSFLYQWRSSADGVTFTDIPGATGRTFTVRAGDADQHIGLRVLATKPGYGMATVAAGQVPIGRLGPPVQKKAGKVTSVALGTAGDRRFTATAGTWSPVPSSLRYEWWVGGSVVASGSSFSCLAVNGCLPGSLVRVTITASRTGSVDGEKTVVARKGNSVPVLGAAGYVYDASTGGHPVLGLGTGPAQVGHVLTAVAPTWTYAAPGGGTVKSSYVWKRNGSAIKGATKVSYKPTTSDLGKRLTVTITTTSSLYPTRTVTVVAGTGRYRQDLVTAGSTASITGTEDAGTAKTATITAWPVSGVKNTYQWYVCDASAAVDCSVSTAWKAISKATSVRYTPPLSMRGDQLKVRITGSRSGYQAAGRMSAPFALGVTDEHATFLSSPTVTGTTAATAAYGRTLTAKPGIADRTTRILHRYAWEACEGPSGGCSTVSTALSYAPQPADFAGYAEPHVRFTQTLEITDGSSSWVADTRSTPRVEIVPGTQTPVVAPKLTTLAGTPRTFAVTGNQWTGATVTYQWYDGTTPIGTGSSAPEPAGTAPVWVEIRAQRTGYVDAVVRLVARAGVIAPGSIPTALNSNQYGVKLQLATPVTVPVNPSSMTVRYQWYTGSTAIKGQTKATFSAGTAYLGKTLRLRVTVTSPYYATYSFYSNVITLQKHAAATGTPGIVSSPGTFAPGATLAPSLSGVTSGLSYAYAWQRRANPSAAWATVSKSSRYVIPAGDAGQDIRLVVTAKKTGWNTATLASAPVDIAYGATLSVVVPLELRGPAGVPAGRVDSAVSAPATWNTSGVTVSYAWLRNGVVVPGATGATLTPTASWIGDELQAVLTATKAGHLPVTVRSDVVKVSAGSAPVATTAPAITRNGSVLSATPGVWSVAGVTFGYSWRATAGGAVLGTGPALDLTAHPGVTSVTLVVTAQRDGYDDGTAQRVFAIN